MHACSTASGGAAGDRPGGGPGPYGSQVSVGSTASRQRPRGHGGMLAGDNKEVKYEQDLEFSATSRQLNYRRAKEERQKKIKRLKQLQKIQQGQKRRTMKRKMTSWMSHGGSFNEAEEDEATATEVAEEIKAAEIELQQLQLELQAEKIKVDCEIKAEASATEKNEADSNNTQRKQRSLPKLTAHEDEGVHQNPQYTGQHHFHPVVHDHDFCERVVINVSIFPFSYN